MTPLTPQEILRWSAAQDPVSHTAGTIGQAPRYDVPNPLARLEGRLAELRGAPRVVRMRVCHLDRPVVGPNEVFFTFQLIGERPKPSDDDEPTTSSGHVLCTITVRSLNELEKETRPPVWRSEPMRWDGSPVPYAGPKLDADTEYRWSVHVRLPGGHSIASGERSFRTALADPHADLGAWIMTAADPRPPDKHDPPRFPVYTLTAPPWSGPKPRSACLHVAAVGFYVARVNGITVSASELTPANSPHQRVLLYDTWNVPHDSLGERIELCFDLAEGYGRDYSPWGWRWMHGPGLSALLRLGLADGSTVDLRSGPEWRMERYNRWHASLYHGEEIDLRSPARTLIPHGCLEVDRTPHPTGELRPRDLPPLVAGAGIAPVREWTTSDGARVYDFGQNIAGWVRLKCRLPGERRVTVAYAEHIDVTGRLDPWTNRDALATDVIIAAAGPVDYQPTFTYHGFRYVSVTGTHGADVTIHAVPVHAHVASWTWFESDNTTLNQLVSNLRWSIVNNLVSIPTDCPQRDERTPCLMDSAVVEHTALRLFCLAGYYRSWVRRILGDDRVPDWSGDQVNAVWLLYKTAGDLSLVQEAFGTLLEWVRQQYAHGAGVEFPGGFGDWCAPNETGGYLESFHEPQLTNSALLHRYAGMMSELARELSHADAAAELQAMQTAIAAGFARRFGHGSGQYGEDAPSQSGTMLALHERIVPEGERAASLSWLVDETRRVGAFHTGIYTTPLILPLFAEAGELDLAISLLLGPHYPSFGYQIKRDATTLWEQWSERGGMNSHDHAMFAGIGDAVLSTVAGIQEVGTGEVRLHGPRIGGLHEAAAVVETAAGPVAFGWSTSPDGGRKTVFYAPPGVRVRQL